MGKQLRLLSRNALEPVPCSPMTSPQSFVFLFHPSGQVIIKVAEDRMERGSVVAAVVVEPAPHHGIKHPGQIVERFVRTPMHSPPPHRLPHRGSGFLTHCRCEVGEVPSEAIL